MKLEYLFSGTNDYSEALAISFDYVEKKVTEIPKKNAYILSFTTDIENDANAKILSNIHNEMCGKPRFKVLTNGSAEYFSKRLFPKINEFETKLRKLLHLAVRLNDDKVIEVSQLVKNLESKTLGEVFKILFSDSSFNSKLLGILDGINSSKRYQKKQLLGLVESLEEEIPWNKIFGDRVQELSHNYAEVNNARNSVAHAHNIDYSQYSKYRTLMHKVNRQLDLAIHSLERQTSDSVSYDKFNEFLLDAVKEYDIAEAISYYHSSRIDNNEFFNSIIDSVGNREDLFIMKVSKEIYKRLSRFQSGNADSDIYDTDVNISYKSKIDDINNGNVASHAESSEDRDESESTEESEGPKKNK